MRSIKILLLLVSILSLFVASAFLLSAEAFADETKNYLGITYYNQEYASELFPGILITSVLSCSPAEISGLLPGDVITHIDNVSVSPENIKEVFYSFEAGSILGITYLREGDETFTKVAIRQISKSPPYLGVNIQNTDGKVLISCVIPNGPADVAGIHPSDYLLTLAGQAVNAENISNVLKSHHGGESIYIEIQRGVSRITLPTKLSSDWPESENKLTVGDFEILDLHEQVIKPPTIVNVDNCYGSEVATETHSYSEKSVRSVQVGNEVSRLVELDQRTYLDVNFTTGPLTFLGIQFAEDMGLDWGIETSRHYEYQNASFYQISNSTETIVEHSIVLSAAPGSISRYQIDYVAVSELGRVNVYAGDTVLHTYEVLKNGNIEYRTTSLPPGECSLNGKTETLSTPIFETEQISTSVPESTKPTNIPSTPICGGTIVLGILAIGIRFLLLLLRL